MVLGDDAIAEFIQAQLKSCTQSSTLEGEPRRAFPTETVQPNQQRNVATTVEALQQPPRSQRSGDLHFQGLPLPTETQLQQRQQQRQQGAQQSNSASESLPGALPRHTASQELDAMQQAANSSTASPQIPVWRADHHAPHGSGSAEPLHSVSSADTTSFATQPLATQQHSQAGSVDHPLMHGNSTTPLLAAAQQSQQLQRPPQRTSPFQVQTHEPARVTWQPDMIDRQGSCPESRRLNSLAPGEAAQFGRQKVCEDVAGQAVCELGERTDSSVWHVQQRAPVALEVHAMGTYTFKGISGSYQLVHVCPMHLASRHTGGSNKPRNSLSSKVSLVGAQKGLLHTAVVDLVDVDRTDLLRITYTQEPAAAK